MTARAANAERTSRGGRPRRFDADAVLSACLDAFWLRGYERTSMADLEAASGLVRTSLYNAFGSKHDVFAAALQRYLAALDARLVAPLRDGQRGLDDIAAFIDHVEGWLAERTPPAGCLVVSAMVEAGGGDDAVRAASETLVSAYRGAFRAALERAATAGELSPASVAPRSELLVGLVLGLNAAARGQLAGTVDALLASGREEIRRWRAA